VSDPALRAPPPHPEEEHPGLRTHPSKLFVEVTTRCNLRCAMCVKEARGQRITEGDMSAQLFARLAPALPRLDALVLNGIGEPLLRRDLERLVGWARATMRDDAWIGFQTNGQLLDRARAHALASAGVDRICLSADALSPDLFRAVRGGGSPAAVEQAALALHEASRGRARELAVGVEFVAMRDNLRHLPDVVRWAARRHVRFVIVTHMLPYSRDMTRAAAFEPSTDRAAQLFRTWKARAAADGVALEGYFRVFLKVYRTPAEQRVVDYVKRMVDDAWAQGVSLHVGRLLVSDDAILREVEDAFAGAAEVARAEGLELRLPAVAPAHVRRCEFVEDGSAFVSWDGDVHPCYFLWHRYSCHLGGVVKRVEPRSFGNVADQDILAIWNATEARAFREAVLRYDFPFCYDCNHSLCDHVQGEEFTQDCHLGTVPCSACLWCTGVFSCLR
jgi:putative metalloenzyme radical SAM/SPASM domain maturase